MNWGLKIALGLGVFMTFIMVLAYLMMTSKNDDLVDADYYEKGISYNVEYQKKTQVLRDQAAPKVMIHDQQLNLLFNQQATGNVKLIRTADKTMDKSMTLKTDSLNQFNIPISGIATGLWKLRIDWTSEGVDYLYEKEVML
ncbi:FixH family protein [Pedobacter sp.]|uniref:FixH family protein n=1 Tax=Pedobacter sp. TaxID=1411316 RepID=UPI003D7FD64B